MEASWKHGQSGLEFRDGVNPALSPTHFEALGKVAFVLQTCFLICKNNGLEQMVSKGPFKLGV